MLQTPTLESRRRNHPNATVSTKPQRDSHQLRFISTRLRAADSLVGDIGMPGARLHQHFAALQRMVGNQVVLRMLLDSPAALQPKLAINEPGDRYEQEADRVADQVMLMAEPAALSTSALRADSGFGCGECAVQQQPQLQRSASLPALAGYAPPIVHDVIRSPGQPLTAATRAFMEPRFGRDFSQVRVHTDARAAASAASVNALAYTVGSQLVLGTGSYAPETNSGRRLLAHELAHVVQQGGNDAALQRTLPCPVTLPSPLPAGWKPYHGDSFWFHCGYTGMLEDRIPTPNDPQGECFYDFSGNIVDEHHPFSGCRGTPNQYDSAKDPLKHGLIDSGGVVRSGPEAFVESRLHDVNSFISKLDCNIRRLYGAPC